MSGNNIGMMDPAYFLGRKAIIDWLNTTFQFNLSKIEETASGAVCCQLLDAIYPGEVSVQRVRWDAKSPHEFIDNYKVIQSVFEKKGVDKYLDVEKLMRGKYQDNLENMQWFKSFFERNYAGQPYDPILRRAKGRGANSMPAFALDISRRGAPHTVPPGEEGAEGGGVAQKSGRASIGGGGRGGGALSSRRAPGGTLANSLTSGSAVPSNKPSPVRGVVGAAHGGGIGAAAASAIAQQQLVASQAQVTELTSTVADLKLTVESLEKERDFYFGKLRDVEILLQSYSGPDRPTVDALFKILYLADDDFVQVEGAEGGAQ